MAAALARCEIPSMRTPRVLLAVVSAIGIVVPAALAAPSSAGEQAGESRGGLGTWSKITNGQVSLTAEPGLFRTSDGVLHVLYRKDHPTYTDLAYSNIAENGSVIATGPAIAGWDAVTSDPKVVGSGSGMRVVFGGIRSTEPADPYGTGQMFSATTNATGTSWTLEPGALTGNHYAVDSYGTGATTLADGTPVVSFPINATLTWNAGAGDSTFDFGACCVYDTTLARSGAAVWVSFAANGSSPATAGQFVKQLLPTVGPTTKAPGSSKGEDVSTPLQSTAFVARPAGGLYLAYGTGYPTIDRVALWRVGSAKPVTVPGSKGAREVALAVSPGGRLWVAWMTYTKVKVVATAATGTKFGTVHTLGRPHGVSDLYGVSVAATNKVADVFINGGSGLYHQQVKR